MHNSWDALKKLENGLWHGKCTNKATSHSYFRICTTPCSSRWDSMMADRMCRHEVCQNYCYKHLICIIFNHAFILLSYPLPLTTILQHFNRALLSPAIIPYHTLLSARRVAKLKLLKPGKIRGEPGHALMACKGHSLSLCSPQAKIKTDGSHFWNVLLYSCLLKCKVNLSRNRIL